MQWKWDAENDKHGYPNKGPGNLMNEGGSHTERKFLHQLDNNKAAKDAIQQGGVGKLRGEFPPCPRCHKKMEEWAKKPPPDGAGKGSLEYHYPVNQCMKYDGNGAAPMTSGAKDLKTAYDTGGSQAWDTYENSKAKGSLLGDANSSTPMAGPLF